MQSAPSNTSQPPPTSGLTVEFYTKLHAAIAQSCFLSTEEDLSSIELFCGLLADLLQTPSSFKDKQEAAKYVTLLSYHLNCSTYRWACLRTYFSLERVKRVVTTFLHFVVAVMNQMVETATDELFPYESTLQLLLARSTSSSSGTHDDARAAPSALQGRRSSADVVCGGGARLHVQAEGREAAHHQHERPRQAGLQDAHCHGRHDQRRPRGGV